VKRLPIIAAVLAVLAEWIAPEIRK